MFAVGGAGLCRDRKQHKDEAFHLQWLGTFLSLLSKKEEKMKEKRQREREKKKRSKEKKERKKKEKKIRHKIFLSSHNSIN